MTKSSPRKPRAKKIQLPTQPALQTHHQWRSVLVVVVLVLLLLNGVLLWFVAGEQLVYPISKLKDHYAGLRTTFTAQAASISQNQDTEERIGTFGVSSQDLTIINKLIAQQQEAVQASVEQAEALTNAISNYAALDRPPYRHGGVNRLRSANVALIRWREYADLYYSLHASYITTLGSVVAVEEQAKAIQFGTEDSAAALKQYDQLLKTIDAADKAVGEFATAQSYDLTATKEYLAQQRVSASTAQAFYQADQKRDIAGAKKQRDALKPIEEKLKTLDPYADFEGFETQSLASAVANTKLASTEALNAIRALGAVQL